MLLRFVLACSSLLVAVDERASFIVSSWHSLNPPSPPSRDLDARAKNERYRTLFRLTQEERLDGHTDCTLWAPFAKMHVTGQLFISNNYICFASREEDLCNLIIPLREVGSCTHARGRTRTRQWRFPLVCKGRSASPKKSISKTSLFRISCLSQVD